MCALHIIDHFTTYRDSYPDKSKAAINVKLAFRDFLGDDSAFAVFSDAAGEIKNAAESLDLLNPTRAPHRPTSRGLVEVHVKACIEGTRCNLSASGLEHKRWPYAVKHCHQH